MFQRRNCQGPELRVSHYSLGFVDRVIGPSAFEHLADLPGRLEGHRSSHVVHGRAEVRREQGPGMAQEPPGDAGRVARQGSDGRTAQE